MGRARRRDANDRARSIWTFSLTARRARGALVCICRIDGSLGASSRSRRWRRLRATISRRRVSPPSPVCWRESPTKTRAPSPRAGDGALFKRRDGRRVFRRRAFRWPRNARPPRSARAAFALRVADNRSPYARIRFVVFRFGFFRFRRRAGAFRRLAFGMRNRARARLRGAKNLLSPFLLWRRLRRPFVASERRIVAALPAYREHVYLAAFVWESESEWRTIFAPQTIPVAQPPALPFADDADEDAQSPPLAVGAGFARYPALASSLGARVAGDERGRIRRATGHRRRRRSRADFVCARRNRRGNRRRAGLCARQSGAGNCRAPRANDGLIQRQNAARAMREDILRELGLSPRWREKTPRSPSPLSANSAVRRARIARGNAPPPPPAAAVDESTIEATIATMGWGRARIRGGAIAVVVRCARGAPKRFSESAISARRFFSWAKGRGATRICKASRFVGRGGQLLDRMLAAIDRKRGDGVYIANICQMPPAEKSQPGARRGRRLLVVFAAANRTCLAAPHRRDGASRRVAFVGRQRIDSQLAAAAFRMARHRAGRDLPSGLFAAQPGRQAFGLGRSLLFAQSRRRGLSEQIFLERKIR